MTNQTVYLIISTKYQKLSLKQRTLVNVNTCILPINVTKSANPASVMEQLNTNSTKLHVGSSSFPKVLHVYGYCTNQVLVVAYNI